MARRTTRMDLRQAGRYVLYALGGLAALNLVFYVVMVRPAVLEYRQVSEGSEPLVEVNDARRVVEEQESYLSAVRKATDDLQNLRDDILSTRNQRLVEVQQEVAVLCEQFNIQLETVSSSTDLLLDEELDRYAMTVPLEGNYRNLRKFLHAVENSDKFLVVERVSLARGKAGGNELSLSIALATYFTAPEDMVTRKKSQGRRRSRG